MVCSSCGLTYDDYCSSNLCSSCCLNTAHGDCGNNCSFDIMCPDGIVWGIDVAQFSTNTKCCDDYLGHTINIHNRAFLTLTQFQQMFYSDHTNLSIANPPQCDNSFCLIASPWVCPSGNTHISDSQGLNQIGPTATPTDIMGYWSNDQITTVFGPSSSSIMIPDGSGIQWCPNRTDHNQTRPHEWIHVYQLPSAQADYIGWGGRYGWIPTNLLTLDPNRSYYNYNCLGGTDDAPYFFLGYLNDVSNNGVYEPFQAQKTIMNNMVKDLDASTNCWDLCARASIYDQLFNLCFANEHSLNNCLELKCGRSWKEIINAMSFTQTFPLQYGPVGLGVEQKIIFSDLPYNSTTADNIFAGNGIVGPEAQGVIIRIRHATEALPDASRNPTLAYPFPASALAGNWVYDQSNNNAGTNLLHTPWNIEPNTPYRITLIDGIFPFNTYGTTTWNYNIVNVGDFVSMRVDAKIHNDHCKINTNTIRINYICKVDQELSDYCGTPVSSNRGFKQDEQGTYYGFSGHQTTTGMDQSSLFDGSFLHTNPQPIIGAGGDDGGLPIGAFDCAGTPADTTPPTATITITPQSAAANVILRPVVIVFSKTVMGFNSDGDVIASDGTVTTMTTVDATDSTTWTGLLILNTPTSAGAAVGSGTLTLGTDWTDVAGNSPTLSTIATYTVV
jgi:hypothetical protein